MRQFSLSEVSPPLAGSVFGDDVHFGHVSTDTRTIQPGDLFVALSGERFDGHCFIETAQSAGAVAALVSEPGEYALPSIQVGDTQRALGRLGAFNREYYSGCLVGITGSAGKTSAKNMLASIFSRAGATLATQGNYNNEIGVPLTLLELGPEHEYAVIEMGAGKRGDIAYLCELASPGICILLNALPAHLETMFSVDNIARTKGEILSGLGGQGTAIFPTESEYAPLWRELAGSAAQLEFGFTDASAVYAADLELGVDSSRFTLHGSGASAEVHLPMPGRHNVANALAAAAAALAAGLSLPPIISGLAEVQATAGRLLARSLRGGIELLDDSYNANPASVKAAVDVLSRREGRRILVLGTMAEMGAAAADLHRDVGAYAAQHGIDALWATGEYSDAFIAGFGKAGRHFNDREALAGELAGQLQPGDVVLVKGSRSAGMESVVAGLVAALGEEGE